MIKKVLITVLMTSCSLLCNAQDDKINKLVEQKDMISYAAGLCHANGFSEYLANTYKISTAAELDDALQGIIDGLDACEEDGSPAYKIGCSLAHKVKEKMEHENKKCNFYSFMNLNIINENKFIEGFCDGVKYGRGRGMTLAEGCEKFNGYVEEVKAFIFASNKRRSNVAMMMAQNNPYYKPLSDGILYRVREEGTGPKPLMTSLVSVEYKIFDLANERVVLETKGSPQQLRCNALIKGLSMALVNMTEGSLWEVFIPYDLAYGADATSDIEPFTSLVVEIKLNKIVEK